MWKNRRPCFVIVSNVPINDFVIIIIFYWFWQTSDKEKTYLKDKVSTASTRRSNLSNFQLLVQSTNEISPEKSSPVRWWCWCWMIGIWKFFPLWIFCLSSVRSLAHDKNLLGISTDEFCRISNNCSSLFVLLAVLFAVCTQETLRGKNNLLRLFFSRFLSKNSLQTNQ